MVGGSALQIRFYVDAETGLAHVRDHGVQESEVEEVLRHPDEDRPGAEGAWIAIGQTEAGRYLRVVYVPEPERDGVFVITAYEFWGKPLLAFRRRRRRRHER